jgi:prepilin-type N-terminal cleavage/methylation domain-containing protein/prepilin-type processing-associated H-X9-DG protein
VHKQRGFTLIELLVVIAIVALLMAILMPALQRVKKQAKAVVCQQNLHEWAIIFSMYVGDNDGYFMPGMTPSGGLSVDWRATLGPYYKKEELILCPLATKTVDEGARYPYAAWGSSTGRRGSYGVNSWIYNVPKPAGGGDTLRNRPAKDFLRSSDVKGASNVPLFGDSGWRNNWPRHVDAPPEFDGDRGTAGYNNDNMKRFCMNRHGGRVTNLAFVDWTARKVGLKELWTLKWHRDSNTAGPWTTAGLVQPSDWPDWMRNFKDY